MMNSSTSFLPLSITASTDNVSSIDDYKNNNKNNTTTTNEDNLDGQIQQLPKSNPSRPPRLPSRTISNQMRNSRVASVVIPVVSTTSDDKDEFVDFDVTIDNSETQQTSPTLPMRPPKTPTTPSTGLEGFKADTLDQYGMDRIKGPQFSPTSLKTKRESFNNAQIENNLDDESLNIGNMKFLIQTRKIQIDHIITILTNANLTVESNVYFEKIHSSNSYIEVLSEIRTGSYETANLPILYSLILNSLKLKEDCFNNSIESDNEIGKKIDNIIDNLRSLLRSTDQQILKFKNDLIRIYSLNPTKNIEPNALVVAFVYRCASKYVLPQASILAILIDEFITKSENDESNEFKFLLLRSIENIDSKLLILNLNDLNPLLYVNNLLKSNDFWCNFVLKLFENDTETKNHPFGLTNVLNNLIIYGVNSLIDVIINLRFKLGIFGCDIENNISNSTPIITVSNLVRFNREFLILNETGSSHLISKTLEKLSLNNQELQEDFQFKNDSYNELLHNYKQLNEEKISVNALIDKAMNENARLNAEKRSLNAQVEQVLGQFDVIKQTLEKNKRVQELNDAMSKEIQRLTAENKKLLG